MIDKEYESARKRVKKKKEFYSHLGSYIAVGSFFFILNIVTSPGDWWFFYPMLGWGIGLVIHYFSVFGIPGLMSSDWEEKALEEEMNRIRRIQEKSKPEEKEEDSLELKDLQKEKVRSKKWDETDLV